MSNWTACTDELPDADTTVLIGTTAPEESRDCGGVWIGYWDGTAWHEINGDEIPVLQWPTHWQHLPEPPAANINGKEHVL